MMKKKQKIENQNAKPLATQDLESQVKLSDSILWRKLRDYYLSLGAQAWKTGAVPCFITSNAFIGHVYAKQICAYIQDYMDRGDVTSKQPFYIIEIGTGHGKLSFYVVKALLKILGENSLPTDCFKYIMTDIAQRNADFWKTHPALKKYIELGVLDYATFDADSDSSIKLQHSGIELSCNDIDKPLSVVGNYIIDTLPHDAFDIIDHQAHASLISTKLSHPIDKEITNANILNYMKHSFTPQKITTDYYPDPVLNEIIAKYAEKFEEASFLIPIGGIKCINTLKALTKDDLILITGDKGYIDQDIFEGREEPFIEADDYAALMVNFDALSKYFLKNKGFSMHMPEKSASFQIMLACFGDKGRYPKLSNAYNEYVAGFGPNDFFNLEDSLFKSNKNPPMTLILSLLRISHWDPHIFYKLKEQIADQIADLDDDYIKDILFELPQVWENFFHLEEEDIPFELGRIFYSVDRLKEAIYYYEQSIHFFGREEATLYNLALCLQESGNIEKALEYFEEVYYMDNDFEDVRKWLKHLKTKSFESTS